MTSANRPEHEHPVSESDREGDIDDDRQDPPRPTKTEGSEDELDGFKATPGDDADED